MRTSKLSQEPYAVILVDPRVSRAQYGMKQSRRGRGIIVQAKHLLIGRVKVHLRKLYVLRSFPLVSKKIEGNLKSLYDQDVADKNPSESSLSATVEYLAEIPEKSLRLKNGHITVPLPRN